jgi:hypothetical protein
MDLATGGTIYDEAIKFVTQRQNNNKHIAEARQKDRSNRGRNYKRCILRGAK